MHRDCGLNCICTKQIEPVWFTLELKHVRDKWRSRVREDARVLFTASQKTFIVQFVDTPW